MSIADEIRKLQELHDVGALTDEEFALAKAAILTPATPAVDENAARISRGLDSLKDTFSEIEIDGTFRYSTDVLRNAVNYYKSVLVTVCGESEFNELRRSISDIALKESLISMSRRSGEYGIMRVHEERRQYDLATLRRWVLDLEYRK